VDRSQVIVASTVSTAAADSLVERDLSSGTRLGDFTLLRQLGRGAQGEVYEARQESLGRLVALKLLPPYLTFNPERVQRFRREAEAGGRLDHPNTVGVHSVGEHDGYHYIAQELVAGGRTLGDEIAAVRALVELPRDWYERMARIFVQVAEAVHTAHEAGIIHRDLKPGNILLTREGQPKVADFGLAMVLDDLHRSRSGELIGTPFYMSPEQAAGGRAGLDRRTDVFSLGTTLYEALTLTRPFDGETRDQVVERIRLHDPPDPRKIRPSVPRELAVICMKALEKRREQRYQSAGEFASDLNRYLRHEPIVAKPPNAGVRAGKWLRRHPVRAGFAAAFVLQALMIVAVVRSGLEAKRQGEFATSRAGSFQQLMYGLLRDLIEPMWDVNSPGPRPAPNDPVVARIAEAEGRAAVLGEHSEARWFTLLAAGCSYRNVSMFEDGERCLTASLDLARGFDDPEAAYQEEHTADYMVIRSAYELGRLRFWTGDLAAAEALLRQARDTSVVRDGAAGEWTFRSTAVLAQVLAAQGRAAEAEEWLRTLVATDWGSDEMLTVQARQLLGRQLLDEERLDEAAALLEPLLEDAKGVYTEKNWLHLATLVAILHDQRGRAARAAGDAAAAETEDRQAEALYVDVQARLVPLRPIAGEQLAYMLGSYGSFLITRGRLDEAREVLGEAVQVGRLSLGEDAAVTLEARGRLGVASYRSGRSAEAEEQWRAVIESDSRAPQPQPEVALNALKNLASLCYRAGRFDEALALAQQRVARTEPGTPAHEDARKQLDTYATELAAAGKR